MPKPVLAFISYTHHDERYRRALDAHLSLLHREGVIDAWHDRRIGPGEDWQSAIDAHLDEAEIVVMLVSAEFIASDYCWGIEVARALEAHEAHRASVLPVIVRPVDWQTSPLGRLQALPTDAKPITKWRNRDEAWTEVARGIRRVARRLRPDGARVEDDAAAAGASIEESTNAVFVVGAAHIETSRQQQHFGSAGFADIPRLIADEGLSANLVLSTGDLAWKGEPQSFLNGWARLEQYGRALGASAIVGTLGNHDLSRRADAGRRFSRPRIDLLDPAFPVPNPVGNTYLERHFAVHVGTPTIVTLDTTAWLEDGGEVDRPQVPSHLAGDLIESLGACSGPKVVLCHHSPLAANGGMELLARLAQTDQEPWVVVYGHEHGEANLVRQVSFDFGRPAVKLFAVPGTGRSVLGWYPGPQVARLDFSRARPDNITFRAWEWLPSRGWRPSARYVM